MFFKALVKNKIVFLNMLVGKMLIRWEAFHEGRGEMHGLICQKRPFSRLLGRFERITTKKMFILLTEIVIVVERQVLLNQYQNLLSQSLHNSACVAWEFTHLVCRFLTS